jgi:hypothetical protein
VACIFRLFGAKRSGVEKGEAIQAGLASPGSFDYGGKGAAFAQDDTFIWGRLG